MHGFFNTHATAVITICFCPSARQTVILPPGNYSNSVDVIGSNDTVWYPTNNTDVPADAGNGDGGNIDVQDPDSDGGGTVIVSPTDGSDGSDTSGDGSSGDGGDGSGSSGGDDGGHGGSSFVPSGPPPGRLGILGPPALGSMLAC